MESPSQVMKGCTMENMLSADASLKLLVQAQHLGADERQKLADAFDLAARNSGTPEMLRKCATEMARIVRTAGGKGERFARG
jgi:hypothetical protein